MYKEAGGERERQTDRQTDRQADRQRLTDKQTDRDRQTQRKHQSRVVSKRKLGCPGLQSRWPHLTFVVIAFAVSDGSH